MAIIELSDVWEMYRIKFMAEGKASWDNFWALRGVTFSVEPGEIVGIIGENGSGKTTILKLIAGMLKPDRGQIKVSKNVSGLLELGAGFQPELTGRENLYLQSELFGLSKDLIETKYEEIVGFAEIGKFIHAPVKCYSQGMFVRLAFAIAIHTDPDILLIDDTLSVGDEYFQRKCIKKMLELKEQSRTIVIVTHDMALLQRLCKRALFMKNGTLVKDDTSSKVVPVYSQAIGSPEGIAIIERGPLGLIFNNGRLFLSWNGDPVTSPLGAYTAFNAGSRWYNSAQAEWEIKNTSFGAFTAAGNFYQLGLTQVWHIEVSDNMEVTWDIELEVDKSPDLLEMHVNVAMKEEYLQWFADSKKGVFPVISGEDKIPVPIFTRLVTSACLGVYSLPSDDSIMKSFLFEKLPLGGLSQGSIINSDYLSRSRILQYRLNPFSLQSVHQADQSICFAGKMVINTADIDGYLSKTQNEFVLSAKDLKLVFDNGRFILEYEGRSLTKNNHISTAVYSGGKGYFSNLAQWEVKKQGSNKIIALGRWPGLALIQIWEAEINGGNSVNWDVSIQVAEELVIDQQHFSIACCDGYSHWFSKYGVGVFPESFRESEMDMLQICLPEGELGLSVPEAQLPELNVKFSNLSHNYAKIINSNFYDKARIMRIDKVDPERANKLSVGTYPCFKLDMHLGRNDLMRRPVSNELKGNRLKIIFSQGSGRIFWDGFELTKKLGLYTSMCSKGRWYDSASFARWKIIENDTRIIKAAGEWVYLPLTQYWQIGIKDDNLIEFNVRMEINKEVEIESAQTNLMVSEIYSRWIKDTLVQDFPVFNNNLDDKWDVIYSSEDNARRIGVAKTSDQEKSLPTITLFNQGVNANQRLNIVNSDVYHRGRLIQCLDPIKLIMAPGNYFYFAGDFSIDG